MSKHTNKLVLLAGVLLLNVVAKADKPKAPPPYVLPEIRVKVWDQLAGGFVDDVEKLQHPGFWFGPALITVVVEGSNLIEMRGQLTLESTTGTPSKQSVNLGDPLGGGAGRVDVSNAESERQEFVPFIVYGAGSCKDTIFTVTLETSAPVRARMGTSKKIMLSACAE